MMPESVSAAFSSEIKTCGGAAGFIFLFF